MSVKKFFYNIYYPKYKDFYKFYSGKEPVGDVFAISR